MSTDTSQGPQIKRNIAQTQIQLKLQTTQVTLKMVTKAKPTSELT